VIIIERFIESLDFNDKHANPIANAILEALVASSLNFHICAGGSFDNAATIAGRDNGVQAHLKMCNENFIFIPCGYHILNLVRAQCNQAKIRLFIWNVSKNI